MTLHASWVHGNAVRPEWIHDNLMNVVGGRWDLSVGDVPWSDINGLPTGPGTTYRGRRSVVTHPFGAATSNDGRVYWFHVPITTPVITAGLRAQLLRVFLLYQCSPGAALSQLHVFDGVDRIGELPVTFGATGRSGAGGSLGDLVEGTTAFGLAAPRPVMWGIGISAGFFFERDGATVTFMSAGADFDV